MATITLWGDLVGILKACAGVDKEKFPGAVTRAGSQFSVVAGGRSQRCRTELRCRLVEWNYQFRNVMNGPMYVPAAVRK